MHHFLKIAYFGTFIFFFQIACAASNQKLSQKLTNLVTNLNIVPFQFHYEDNIGLENIGCSAYLKIEYITPMLPNIDLDFISY